MINSIKTIVNSIVLLIIAFGLLYFSFTGVKNNSSVIEALNFSDNLEIKGPKMIKIQDVPQIEGAATYHYQNCGNSSCTFAKPNQNIINDKLYIKYKLERYEIIRKEENDEGTTTISYSEDWVVKDENEIWADFKLKNAEIGTDKVRPVFNTEVSEIESVFINDIEPVTLFGQTPSQQVGKTRLTIESVPVDSIIILVGNYNNQAFYDGDPFLISNKTNPELIDYLKTQETTTRSIIRFFAWFALTVAIASIVNALFKLVSFGFGFKKVSALIYIVAGIISAIIVRFIVHFISYWYIYLILVILIAGGALILTMNSKKNNSDTKKNNNSDII